MVSIGFYHFENTACIFETQLDVKENFAKIFEIDETQFQKYVYHSN